MPRRRTEINLWDPEYRKLEKKEIKYTNYRIRQYVKMMFGQSPDNPIKKFHEFNDGQTPWWVMPLLLFIIYFFIVITVIYYQLKSWMLM